MSEWTVDDADLLFRQANVEAGDDHPETAAALFDQAAEAFLACGDTVMAARSLRLRGANLHNVGDHPSAAAAYLRASELAVQAGDLQLRLRAMWGRASTLATMEEWPIAAAIADEAVPLMRSYALEDDLGDMLLVRARAHEALGDSEAALATAAEAHRVFRAQGNIPAQVSCDDFAVGVLVGLDRFDDALPKARRNVDIVRASTEGPAVAYHLQRLGVALMLAGRASEAQRELAAARDLFTECDRPGSAAVAATWLAECLASAGSTAEAENLLRSSAAVLDALGPHWSAERADALDLLSEVQYSTGEFASAAQTARELLAERGTANRFDVVGRLTASLVQEGRASDAVGYLRTLPVDAPGGEEDADILAACLAWAEWHADDRAAASERARALLLRPGHVAGSVAEAWLQHIAGAATDPGDLQGTARLARAAAIYQQHEEQAWLADLAALILERTRP